MKDFDSVIKKAYMAGFDSGFDLAQSDAILDERLLPSETPQAFREFREWRGTLSEQSEQEGSTSASEEGFFITATKV